MQAVAAKVVGHNGHTVGQLVREWRAARGMSQLDLALRSGFSSRHVSFVETGRTQPSRPALLALAESLHGPLRERNRLLEAGGYACLPPDAARVRRNVICAGSVAVPARPAQAISRARPRPSL